MKQILISLTLLSFLLVFLGCGIRGAPVPPENPLFWPERAHKNNKPKSKAKLEIEKKDLLKADSGEAKESEDEK